MLERQPATDGIHLIARRNCALSPRQLGRVFIAVVALSLLVASVCVVLGAWVVLPWTVLEISAVGVAFVMWGRHANDRESIRLGPGQLLVEVHDGSRIERLEFNPQWVQLLSEPVRLPGASVRLLLREGGQEVEIGRHLDEAGRRSLAQELRAALARLR